MKLLTFVITFEGVFLPFALIQPSASSTVYTVTGSVSALYRRVVTRGCTSEGGAESGAGVPTCVVFQFKILDHLSWIT